jgi:hypothetical protein
MSSTRNRNTPGDYNLVKKADEKVGAYLSYSNYGVPNKTIIQAMVFSVLPLVVMC